MTNTTSPRLRSLSSTLLCVCSMLFGLTACDPEQIDSDAEFRAGDLDLDSLKPGQCLPLADELTTVTTEEWTIGAGVPKGIIIDDHLLLTSIFEDNVMLRISGPAGTYDDTLATATATVLYNSPELDDDCGFCDGLCVDGKCIMNLPPFAVGPEGICAN